MGHGYKLETRLTDTHVIQFVELARFIHSFTSSMKPASVDPVGQA